MPWTLAVGIVLVALNLRVAVTSLGALLGQVTAELHMSGAVAGLLTTLPVLCFAVVGGFAPRLGDRLGERGTMLAAMGALVAGLVLRVVARSWPFFAAATALALAGIAISNVMLPVLVKRHFPRRVGLLTATYTTALAVGTTLGAAVTVPAEHAVGRAWRGGLGVWAAVAVLGLLPWLKARSDDISSEDHTAMGGGGVVRLARSRLAWAMAVYFGAQSVNAYAVFGWLPAIYRTAGLSAENAGLLLALVTALLIPISLVIPVAAARTSDQRPYVLLAVGCYLCGYVGLLVAPAAGAWAWALLLGTGGGAFPLALTMISLRSPDAAGTAALSGFSQGIGYLLAVAGPLLIGVLHGRTGAWGAPIALLLASLVPLAVSGMIVGRPGRVEEVDRRT